MQLFDGGDVHTAELSYLQRVRAGFIFTLATRRENGVASISKSLCCSIAHHAAFSRSPCYSQKAWWTTESSPVYASPREEDPEGQMMELVNASEMVSREKHPGKGNGKPPLSTCQENCHRPRS